MTAIAILIHSRFYVTIAVQIYDRDVNFWVLSSPQQLKNMCDKKSYPPRYILNVFPALNASSGKAMATSLKVEFPGAVYTWFADDKSIVFILQLESFRFRTASCKL